MSAELSKVILYMYMSVPHDPDKLIPVELKPT